MQIAEGHIVDIEYTLTRDTGEKIDESEEGKPFSYLHGKNNIVPGLEKELTGRSVGDFINLKVEPENGYGEVKAELIQDVPRSAFNEVKSIEIGMQFQVSSDDGQDKLVTITDIQEATVTVDGNHPLAGETLIFDVRIKNIRLATEEELKCGYAQGKCGCC